MVGSWYGAHPGRLTLGLAFHRSHVSIKASQVSRIAAGLSDRWTKQRRFAAAFDLVRQLRPSRFLLGELGLVSAFTTATTGSQLKDVYDRLESGEVMAACFEYKA